MNDGGPIKVLNLWRLLNCGIDISGCQMRWTIPIFFFGFDEGKYMRVSCANTLNDAHTIHSLRRCKTGTS